jgi:hypothetical protein
MAQPQALPQPMAIQPQMPAANVNPTQPMLTMIDKSASYNDFITAGWTDALLIQHGKAMLMPAANAVFPPTVAPPVVAPPTIATPVQAPALQNIPAPQPSAAAMFNQMPIAPVQNMALPQAISQAVPQGIPQAMPMPPVSAFEQPQALSGQAEPDDLPF